MKKSEDFLDRVHANADMMRENPTKAEGMVLQFLLDWGFEFQVVLHGYIPDFVHFDRKIIIEIDGKDHEEEDRKERDKEKDRIYRKKGFKIIRIKNEEIYRNVHNVFERFFYLITERRKSGGVAPKIPKRKKIESPKVKEKKPPKPTYCRKCKKENFPNKICTCSKTRKDCLGCGKIMSTCMVFDKCIRCRSIQ